MEKAQALLSKVLGHTQRSKSPRVGPAGQEEPASASGSAPSSALVPQLRLCQGHLNIAETHSITQSAGYSVVWEKEIYSWHCT